MLSVEEWMSGEINSETASMRKRDALYCRERGGPVRFFPALNCGRAVLALEILLPR